MLIKIYLKLKIFIATGITVISAIFVLYAQPPTETLTYLIATWKMEEAGKLLDKLDNTPPGIRGLYSFYEGNYSEAYRNFNQEPERYPRLLNIVERLEPIHDKFELTESKYFKIYSTGKDRVLALYAGEILDAAAENLEKYFDYNSEGEKPEGEKVILEIYPDRESFQTASTLTDKHMKASGAVGICKFNRLMVSSPAVLKFGYGWPDTITHEYVHYLIGKITGLSNMPLWLNEGLARHLEEAWEKPVSSFTPDEINRLYLNRSEGNWVPLDKMSRGMPSLDNRDEVALAYAQVHSMTDYMANKYGYETIAKLLRRLPDKKADEALKEIMDITREDFFENWQRYIRSKDLIYTPGAAGANYAFKDDPVSAVSEWVSQTAKTDIYLARQFIERKKYRLSEKKYLDALEKDPGNAIILTRLAKVNEKNGDREVAEKNLLKAIKNNPSYAPPYKYLGLLYFERGQLPPAESYMKEYIYIQPFDPKAHRYLEDIYAGFNEEKLKRREERALEIINEN